VRGIIEVQTSQREESPPSIHHHHILVHLFAERNRNSGRFHHNVVYSLLKQPKENPGTLLGFNLPPED